MVTLKFAPARAGDTLVLWCCWSIGTLYASSVPDLLPCIQEKQLLAVDFVSGYHALPRRRNHPIDKLLRLDPLGLRMFYRVDHHHGMQIMALR